MLESKFQSDLIKKIKHLFPGCVNLKNDPNYLQGFPDLTILHGNKWAALEVKVDADAPLQPNQEYYIDKLHNMSYASFVFPWNEEEVLRELELALKPSRDTRVSFRQ